MPERNPSGAAVIARALHGLGVTVIFGLVGVPVADIAEEAINLGIRFIGFRNEQACSYAATVYGYLTGKPGICLLVGGPGILHGMAGIGNASANGFPTVFFGGASEEYLNGKGAFQEMDSIALLTPHTKAAIRPPLNDSYSIVSAIHRAYRICWYGRPGPTFIDLRGDLIMQSTAASRSPLTLKSNPVPAPPKPAASANDIEAAATLIRNSKSPLVIIGKGAAFSRSESIISDLINTHNLPFLPTPMGKGVISDSHPLNTTSARSAALVNADVVIFLGARLNWILHYGEPPKYSPSARFIQIDISPEELSRVNGLGNPSFSLFGDIGVITSQIHSALGSWTVFPSPSISPSSTSSYLRILAASAAKNNSTFSKKSLTLTQPGMPLTYERAYHILNAHLQPHSDSIVYISEGANTMDISRSAFPLSKPRQRLDAGTYATMGVGMGYAVAAYAAYNYPAPGTDHAEGKLIAGGEGGKRIVCLMGDSAFGFSGMEIETLARLKMPALIFVMNNSGIYHGDSLTSDEWDGKQTQTVSGIASLDGEGKRRGLRSTSLLWEARYEKMAEMVGGKGYFVRTEEELERSVREGWEEICKSPEEGGGKVALVNVVIEAGLGKTISFAWENQKQTGNKEGAPKL